jgi:cell division protease FtsH
LAARANAKQITDASLESAIEKVLIGPERRSKLMSEGEKRIAAYHEVGHALVGHFLEHSDPIHKISLVSRGSALGYTWSLPEADRRMTSRATFRDEIAQALGGREAEQLVFRDTTTGAENDLKKATKIAQDKVRVYGMSDALGPVQFGLRDELVFLGRDIREERNYSDAVAETIDTEVRRLVNEGAARATHVLKTHRSLMDTLTARLLEVESIDREEFERLVTGKPLTRTAVKRPAGSPSRRNR